MKKDLETFIKENRAAFDNKKIDAQVWQRLNDARTKKQRTGLLSSLYFKWAAVAAIVIICGIFYFLNNDKKENIISGDVIVREQYPEFDARIKSFASQIETKKSGLKVIQNEQPGIYDHFVTDLAGLNNNYEKLRNELAANPNRNAVLTEMIENLELQLRLLNQQLDLIRQLKSESKGNEKEIIRYI